MSDPLGSSANWMKFLAVLAILGGVSSLIGALAAIYATWWTLPTAALAIWYGILLYSAGSAARKAVGSGRASDLQTALRTMGLYFQIAGVAALISLIVSVLSLCTSMTHR